MRPLDAADQAELDELRALLADPTLWSEPPAELEDSVVALIAAEAECHRAGSAASSADPPARGRPADRPQSRSDPTDDARLNRSASDPAEPGTDYSRRPSTSARPGERKQERPARRRFTRPAFLVAAAAAVVAVALSAVLMLRDPRRSRGSMSRCAATELAPGASGNAVMLKTDSGWEIQLDANGLPRLDNGQFYQAWLRNADGVLVPIGTFNEGTDVILWVGRPARPISRP